jgi:hypothetical protein
MTELHNFQQSLKVMADLHVSAFFTQSDFEKVQKFEAAKEVLSWKVPMSTDICIGYIEAVFEGREILDQMNDCRRNFVLKNTARYN